MHIKIAYIWIKSEVGRMHWTGEQTLYMSSSVYKPKFHFPQWTAQKGKMQKFEFRLQRPQVSEKFERTDSRICYSDMAFGDLHLTFEEHTNTINADVFLQMWLNVLVLKRYERPKTSEWLSHTEHACVLGEGSSLV